MYITAQVRTKQVHIQQMQVVLVTIRVQFTLIGVFPRCSV